MQQTRRTQLKQSRLEIVAELYKRAYCLRKIREEVMRRLGLKTYSLQTVHSDVKLLLNEWRESRISDVGQLVQLELERIDDAVRELWAQWDKSKQDYKKTQNKSKGAPKGNDKGNEENGNTIQTYMKEKTETDVMQLGDASFISEIRLQLVERRKLLGLYAPEKIDMKQDYDISTLTPAQREALLAVSETILKST